MSNGHTGLVKCQWPQHRGSRWNRPRYRVNVNKRPYCFECAPLALGAAIEAGRRGREKRESLRAEVFEGLTWEDPK